MPLRSLVPLVIALPGILLSVGCGGGAGVDDGRDRASPVVERSGSANPPYGGPLDARAAVAALECVGKALYRRGGDHSYDDGLATVQSSAEAALEDYMRESGLLLSTPYGGYAVEREQPGRVLFSYDVNDRTKVSVLAAAGVRDWNGDEGWGVRSWAQCDPSEFPEEVTDELNIGVWEDESGVRVPVTQIQSFQGAEHCSWMDITFLLVGPERFADWYVRDTGGDFPGLLRTTFADQSTISAGATDTGLRRDGRALWIGPNDDAAYLVSIDDPRDVERWPAAKQPLLCA